MVLSPIDAMVNLVAGSRLGPLFLGGRLGIGVGHRRCRGLAELGPKPSPHARSLQYTIRDYMCVRAYVIEKGQTVNSSVESKHWYPCPTSGMSLTWVLMLFDMGTDVIGMTRVPT